MQWQKSDIILIFDDFLINFSLFSNLLLEKINFEIETKLSKLVIKLPSKLQKANKRDKYKEINI